jgi:hypothetical protein
MSKKPHYPKFDHNGKTVAAYADYVVNIGDTVLLSYTTDTSTGNGSYRITPVESDKEIRADNRVTNSEGRGTVVSHYSEYVVWVEKEPKGKGQPRLAADEETITARVPMPESMHKHCMAQPGGLAAYIRSLVVADQEKAKK